jgi:hypothetical protein
MATRINEGVRSDADLTVVRRVASETKSSIKTTELLVLILAVAGVLVASSQDDSLDGQWAWTLVAALAIGYMLSRGLAKAGSDYAGDD